MKFALIFDGELRSNGSPTEKWEIRKKFDPQLRELWKIHPSLNHVEHSPYRYAPKPGSGIKYAYMENHHSFNEYTTQHKLPEKHMDLCETIERGGRRFFPLVRESFALKCALKILFLRKEAPGRVYQAGDLDNRLKTLFDALGVPPMDQVCDGSIAEDPIYCLLEDDALIMHCDIETHRLLSRPEASKYEVHLVVEVDVRVTQPRAYNIPFLGD